MHAGDRENTESPSWAFQGARGRPSSVLHAVADGILVIDERAAVVDMNSAAEKLLARPLAEVSGWSVAARQPALEPQLPVPTLLERSRERRGIYAEASDVNGAPIPVHVTVSESTDGDSARYVLVMRDFRPIHAAQRRVLETERLAAIGETMTALAHESRNALQRMQSCLTLLKLRGDEEVQELVDDMQDAQDQLQRLYEEVRDFAAPLQLRLRTLDMRKLLEGTWRQLRIRWAPKELGWSIDHDEAVETRVSGDAERLAQVFRNILQNAIEASPRGGRVVAQMSATHAEEQPALRVVIADEGAGMSQEATKQAFDLLYTTKQGGTGMGLAIARRIVREHGGEITIEEAAHGARLAVTLPREQTD